MSLKPHTPLKVNLSQPLVFITSIKMVTLRNKSPHLFNYSVAQYSVHWSRQSNNLKLGRRGLLESIIPTITLRQ